MNKCELMDSFTLDSFKAKSKSETKTWETENMNWNTSSIRISRNWITFKNLESLFMPYIMSAVSIVCNCNVNCNENLKRLLILTCHFSCCFRNPHYFQNTKSSKMSSIWRLTKIWIDYNSYFGRFTPLNWIRIQLNHSKTQISGKLISLKVRFDHKTRMSLATLSTQERK